MADDATGEPIQLFAGWDVGPLSNLDAITVRLRYLLPATMEMELTPFIAIKREQVRELVDAMHKAIAKLDALQASPGGNTRQ